MHGSSRWAGGPERRRSSGRRSVGVGALVGGCSASAAGAREQAGAAVPEWGHRLVAARPQEWGHGAGAPAGAARRGGSGVTPAREQRLASSAARPRSRCQASRLAAQHGAGREGNTPAEGETQEGRAAQGDTQEEGRGGAQESGNQAESIDTVVDVVVAVNEEPQSNTLPRSAEEKIYDAEVLPHDQGKRTPMASYDVHNQAQEI